MKIEVEGLDAVVRSLESDAATIRPKVETTVLAFAGLAEDGMYQRTRSNRVAESLSSDTEVTRDGHVVYADAGPDRRKSNQAFIARFLERGTVKMAPQPFAAPTLDDLAPKFERALADLIEE